MSNIRRNFKPTAEEALRRREGKRLGITDRAIPLDTDIKQYANLTSRLAHGEVKVVQWSISGLTYTLRFSKKQPLIRLLNELHEAFGDNLVENEVSTIRLELKQPSNKKEVSEKLKRFFVKTT